MPTASIERVLVGIDFSASSDAAARCAVRVASLDGADVWLVHVAFAPEHAVRQSLSLEPSDVEAPSPFETTRRKLEEMAEELSREECEVHSAVYEGYPDSGICRAASELGADLVVVGSHGQSGVTRVLLGNVAERVVRSCEQNVLVARGEQSGAGGFRRALAPTDFSEVAARAWEHALLLTERGGRLDLLHCVERQAGADGQKADPLVRSGERLGLDVRYEEALGAPASCILDRLEGADYDLVVVGSHGHAALRRWLLGSVAETTARYAPCSVVVVHEAEQLSRRR